MPNKNLKEKKVDPFEDIINILEDYEKDIPKPEGKVSPKNRYESCMCGTEHGDDRDKDKEHAYHLSELTDEPISKEDLKKQQKPIFIEKDDYYDDNDVKEEEE